MARPKNSIKHLSRNRIHDLIRSFAQFIPTVQDGNLVLFEHQFMEMLDRIDTAAWQYPDERIDFIRFFYQCGAEYFEQSDLIRHCKHKPMGYAGDYQLIDWFYTKHHAAAGPGYYLDDFVNRLAGAQAVRNRKNFLTYTFNELTYKKRGPISLLNLASGPCRDIAEMLASANPHTAGSTIHCVDMDNRAIAYAQTVTHSVTIPVHFVWEHKNAFLLRMQQQYDFVWSGGLFDYLNDRLAIALMHRMWKWTKPGGKMIVGNFHPHNPSRNFMEWCGEWFLIHRTHDAMRELCIKAGIPPAVLTIDHEPLHTVVFAIAEKPYLDKA